MMTSTLFGSFKRIAVSVVVLTGIAFAQTPNLDTNIKGSRWPAFGTDSGTANAYVLTTVAPLGPGLRTGSCFEFFATHANTAASTLNVDSTGAIAIKKSVSSALAAGDIVLNGMTQVCYDGTNYQLVFSPGYFAGIAGGVIPKSCIVTIGDPGAGAAALVDTDDAPAQCGNDLGSDITITAASCWADAGSPTVTPILTGGSSTSVLTGALTCGTASWAAGTVNGTPTLHSFSSNGATCSSTPCTLDANITSAGGTAKYIVMKFTGSAVFGVSPGTGTVTSVGTGTGLTGGPIIGTGTISLANTAVTPGSYTSTDLTVDAQGRITAASNGTGGGTSVSVNGSSVSSPNFNDTTPAAASNNLNVTWQVSGANVSAQIAAATNSTLGLIKSATCGSNNWISSITTGTGAIGCSQPAFSNLSGSLACAQMPTLTGDVTNSLCAMTAVALHLGSTPTLCSSGNFARGIDANGNATGCTAAPGAGGSGTAGPMVDVAACSNVDASGSNIASLGCSSGAISGDTFVMFCQFFTNDGGTATLAASSSPAETWTTDKTFFSTGIVTPSRSSVFRTTVASTATYTFTCSPSTSKPYAFMSVFKVTGVTGVDASTTGTGATGVITTGLITTATDNDLIFLHAATNGSDPNCDAPTQTPMSWNLIQRGDIGSYLGVKKAAAAGSYTLAAKGCNSSWGAIGIAYK